MAHLNFLTLVKNLSNVSYFILHFFILAINNENSEHFLTFTFVSLSLVNLLILTKACFYFQGHLSSGHYST